MSSVAQSQRLEDEKKFVAFRLNQEYYAIDVFQVQEVFTPTSITPIPQAPEFTAGVINFRGTIVTVLDLKQRLQVKERRRKTAKKGELEDEEERLYVIIVKTKDSVIGLLVDYVESVIAISSSNIQSTIELIGKSSKSSFLAGVARTDLGLTILLNLESLIADYDIVNIEELKELREKILSEQGSGEIVVDDESMLDLDRDDISQYESQRRNPEFKRVSSSSSSDMGSDSLDLNILTKPELLKIAKEMEIDEITTRSSKQEILDAIDKKMNP